VGESSYLLSRLRGKLTPSTYSTGYPWEFHHDNAGIATMARATRGARVADVLASCILSTDAIMRQARETEMAQRKVDAEETAFLKLCEKGEEQDFGSFEGVRFGNVVCAFWRMDVEGRPSGTGKRWILASTKGKSEVSDHRSMELSANVFRRPETDEEQELCREARADHKADRD